MKKDVVLLMGAGQIGMAIVRRVGAGKSIIVGDSKEENARAIAKILRDAGFDAQAREADLASRESIKNLIAAGENQGEIAILVNAAGLSPSQASIEAILRVDLYGTAVLLEEVGKVIRPGGTGVTISSQSGHRLEALGAEKDACSPKRLPKSCSSWIFCNPGTSRTPCAPTSSPSAAMSSASWPRPSSGENAARGSTPSRPASS